MALNLSHRPIFREGCSENHGERFCSPLIPEGEFKDCFDYGRDRNKTGGSSQELISGDIIDRLPPDPFGMEMSTTFTAITGWLENWEVDYFGYGGNQAGNSAWDYQLFTGLDLLWNNAMLFHALPGSVLFDWSSYVPNGIGESSEVKPSPVDGTGRSSDTMETKCHLDFGLNCGLEGFSEIKAAGGSSCDNMYGSTSSFGASANQVEISIRSDASCDVLDFSATREIDNVSSSIGFVLSEGFDGFAEKIQSESVSPCCSDGDGVPHLALDFVLGYLSVQDLLSIERVCKSLRSTVRTDALLWQSIYIGQPLNERITDDILLQLSARAQGNLKCLTLVECIRISDDCLKRVVLSNPTLTKLCVPGCTRLRINGILDILKTLKSMGSLRVKHLRVGGIYGTTIDQFEELKSLLGLDCKQQYPHKPHFFRREKYLSFEDDSEIDIEVCPRCQNLRLVYDCPSETCQAKLGSALTCRACTICKPRCVQCGQCINDGEEYEENFWLEVLCRDCSPLFEDVDGGCLEPKTPLQDPIAGNG